jgi:hypothetical protein
VGYVHPRNLRLVTEFAGVLSNMSASTHNFDNSVTFKLVLSANKAAVREIFPEFYPDSTGIFCSLLQVCGTWNVRSMYKAGSLRAVPEEISKFKLDLVGVQKFRWDGGGTEPAGEYIFFCGKGNETYEIDSGFFFVNKRIMSAFKKVEFVSDT